MREGFLWKPPLLLLSPLLTLLSPGVLTRSGVRVWSILLSRWTKLCYLWGGSLLCCFMSEPTACFFLNCLKEVENVFPIRFRTTIEIIVLIMPKFSSLFFTNKKLTKDGLINWTQNKVRESSEDESQEQLGGDSRPMFSACWPIQFQTLIPSTNSAYPARGYIKLSINA